MQFFKRDGCVPCLNSTNKFLVIVIESFKDFVGEFFIINWCSEKSLIVCLGFDKLHEFRDAESAFDCVFELDFELFDAATGWFGIGIGQNCPGLFGCFSLCDEWYDTGGDGANYGVEEELILPSP